MTRQKQAARASASSLIQKMLEETTGKTFQENRWGKRHVDAWERAIHGGVARHYKGSAVVRMMDDWALYADSHFDHYDAPIGDDGFLGPEWEQIGKSLLAMLNGEMGDFDCGTLDGLIRDILTSQGFEGDNA